MIIVCCEICGEKLPEKEKLVKRQQSLPYMQNPGGYFTFAHLKARVNEEGKVVSHEWGVPCEALCPECADRIDTAIRSAIAAIMLDSPQTRTYKAKAPYMDIDPIHAPEESPCLVTGCG